MTDKALIVGDPGHKYNQIIAGMLARGEVKQETVRFACFHDDDYPVWNGALCNCDVKIAPVLASDVPNKQD